MNKKNHEYDTLDVTLVKEAWMALDSIRDIRDENEDQAISHEIYSLAANARVILEDALAERDYQGNA